MMVKCRLCNTPIGVSELLHAATDRHKALLFKLFKKCKKLSVDKHGYFLWDPSILKMCLDESNTQ